jgi:hypothetical protein
MASGTADLQRDLGGAVMQSIFGALLTAGYAAAFAAAIGSLPTQYQQNISSSIEAELQKSFSSAAISAICERDHGRRKILIPGGMRLGLSSRNNRDPNRWSNHIFQISQDG